MPGPMHYEKPRDDYPTVVRAARIAITLALIPLGFWKLGNPYERSIPLLDEITVAIHEFGHMLFMPFGIAIGGDVMVALGGSLFQIVFPVIFVLYFLFSKKHRDQHAAMVCLWYVAVSLTDLSIYVGDARALDLTLINGLTGKESDAHDWEFLLSHWGVIKKDVIYAQRMRAVAWLFLVISAGWGLIRAIVQKPDSKLEPSDEAAA